MTIFQHRDERVYFDTCTISRLFDAIKTPNMEAEAEKIQEIIESRILGGYSIIGSMVVTSEIDDTSDDGKREAIETLYSEIVADEVELSLQSIARADILYSKGLGVMDSYHLAAAEAAGVDYLLTTDVDFIEKCTRPNFTVVKVINPIDF
jgi:predicted nucleic acid-binding protein